MDVVALFFCLEWSSLVFFKILTTVSVKLLPFMFLFRLYLIWTVN